MHGIDAHLHVTGDHADTLALLEELDLKLVNITVSRDPLGQWRPQAQRYRELAQNHPNRFAWGTAFDMPDLDAPDFDPAAYAGRAIEGLQADFAAGAVAMKVWKNIGLSLRRPGGQYVMIDDALFEPIFTWLEQAGRPVLIHVADPLEAWLPLTPGTPHYHYFSRARDWHFHGRSDMPSHGQIIHARDRVVERHPRLRVIAAHLGSMEHDLDQMAIRLRAWPNFAMDVSARLADLVRHTSINRQAVRGLFLEFSDRLIFGTDMVGRAPHSQLDPAQRADALRTMRDTYETWWRFFATDQPVQWRGQAANGIALPEPILHALYEGNARRWLDNL